MYLLTHQPVSLSVRLLSLTDENVFDLDGYRFLVSRLMLKKRNTRVGPVSGAEKRSGAPRFDHLPPPPPSRIIISEVTP